MYLHLNGICTHACICVCYVNRHTLLNSGYVSNSHEESLETWFNLCFSSFCFWYFHFLPPETLTFSSSQLFYFLLFKQLGWYYNDFPKEPSANPCISLWLSKFFYVLAFVPISFMNCCLARVLWICLFSLVPPCDVHKLL